MKYAQFSLEEFIQDDYFQQWVLDNDAMTDNFWNNWLSKNPDKKEIVEKARKGVRLMAGDEDKLSDADFDTMWQNIIEKRDADIASERTWPKSKGRKLYWWYAAAASIVLIVALSLSITKGKNTNGYVEPIIVNNQIEPGIEKATLTLEDGSDITLEKGAQYQNSDANSNGEAITYNNGTSNKLAYNYLTVPRGGQFQLTLSDGTHVWLNSETQLKYPVRFVAGQSRQVELVYGEAYFDVSPSTAHQGSYFKVYHSQQEIGVLGTEFNIKAYRDENYVYTTLVEGKVEVTTSFGKEILNPGQQSVVSPFDTSISIFKTNVYNAVSWKEGVFSFNDKSLRDIMKVLGRWYDMEVEFENVDVQNEEFIGVLGRTQSIEGVMSTMKSIGVIDNYEINQKKLIIK